MANNKLIVSERQTELGSFMIGRLLPFRKKRQVGPFTFIDHMGPTLMGNGNYLDVDQHPHIGLSTLTYLLRGEIEHRDSLGTIQIVRPGDIAFMTAGSGVTHTERTPQTRRGAEHFQLHGYQIWVALPAEQEEMAPQFDFYPSDTLPQWKVATTNFKLLAGQAFGRTSPLRGFSTLFMVDIYTEQATTIPLAHQLVGEVAFVIVKGTIQLDGEKLTAGQMLISKTDDQCEICLDDQTQVLLFGGEPLPQEPLLLWNFVSHRKERLQQAKADWQNKNFPRVPNDDSYIPFPNANR